jgi:hypothetical protein
MPVFNRRQFFCHRWWLRLTPDPVFSLFYSINTDKKAYLSIGAYA